MKKITLIIAISLFTLTQLNAQKTEKMENEIDSVSYSLGMLFTKNLKGQGIDTLNYELFMQAMQDVFEGNDFKIPEQACNGFVNTYIQGLSAKKAEMNKAAGKKFLDENAKKKGVKTTASGLQYEVLVEGKGPKPKDVNTNVTAHYHGTLIDGTVFDSSVNRGQPFVTNVGQVIKAWQEALLMMNVGTKLRIYCPSDLAYGERGAGGAIGPNSVLIFEMELISINN